MKKLILLVVLICAALTGFSQRAMTRSVTDRIYADTNTNSAVKYLYTPMLPANNLTSVRFVGSKISGTVTGSVALQYTLDTTGLSAGTNTWFTMPDSLTMADVTTNTRAWYTLGHARMIRLRVTTITNPQALRITGLFIRK